MEPSTTMMASSESCVCSRPTEPGWTISSLTASEWAPCSSEIRARALRLSTGSGIGWALWSITGIFLSLVVHGVGRLETTYAGWRVALGTRGVGRQAQ